jgi:hypothetical protein
MVYLAEELWVLLNKCVEESRVKTLSNQCETVKLGEQLPHILQKPAADAK